MKRFGGAVFWVGVYLFVLGVTAVVYSIEFTDTANFLWFSYISLLLIGAGMMWGNSKLIVAQLNIILLPVLIWDLDFVLNLFGFRFLGITDYYFDTMISWGKFVGLEHLYVLPLGLWAVWKIGLNRKDVWRWSFLEVAVIWVLSFLFTDRSRNVNCVFEGCAEIAALSGGWYYLAWVLVVGSVVFGVNWGIWKWLGKK